MTVRHFLTLDDIPKEALRAIVARAIAHKKQETENDRPFLGKTLALLFEHASTRTRTAFTVGMHQLGGHVIFLSSADAQIGRGESIADTARVLSSMVDAIAVRTDTHDKVREFARYATKPVINALCDTYHPCQLLADVQTVIEVHGEIRQQRIAWIGDGNNVCHSFMNAARIFDFHLVVATPPDFAPSSAIYEKNRANVLLTHDAFEAVTDADVVVTDTWSSMGQEAEKSQRIEAFKAYRVDANLMRRAKSHAIFMHCLPAYRGLEVTEDVIDGSQSVVWQEAENRLHAQKALLEYLLCTPNPS